MKKKLFFAGLLFGLVAVVIISWGWCAINDPAQPERSQDPPFYFGIPEKPVYSKSMVDSPKSSYVFDPVLQFDLVKHDFTIKNTSDHILELKKATGCCGSIVEAFSPQIPPGQEGVIKIVLLTDRRGGETIQGKIRAMTNDPRNPEWTIEISCLVKKFADISEHTIMLNGSWRSALEGSSFIVPTAEYPFKILSCKAKRGLFIKYGYKETIISGKKGYLVWAKNTRKEPGVIRDSIYIQTDNPSRPQFLIRVQGKLTD